ncbi:MAG TPA: type III-B CRISPR module-associated Cmr3 family protein, partial [Candidatus Ozemobacteraceae bacterium]|nr:type III-B CRISPR module-associated Cmr3 family protein [Candidatus Ozemobacteraceae bacterium]
LAFDDQKGLILRRLKPEKPLDHTRLSSRLPLVPILQAPQKKPLGSLWLTEKGWNDTLAGKIPPSTELHASGALWKSELRLGIALDGQTRTAADGKLFTSNAISLHNGVGFLVGIEGVGTSLPECGGLRLAGDGRGADYRLCTWKMAPPPVERIRSTGAFRLVMVTPGIFNTGWVPSLVENIDGTYRLRGKGFSARLACAALAGSETVSGWDLAREAPKPALRAVPAGSVYWFDEFDGQVDALASWVENGLWTDGEASVHRAEGFNRAHLGVWIE